MIEMRCSSFDRLEVHYEAARLAGALWNLNISIHHDGGQLAGVLEKMPLLVIPSRLHDTRQVEEFRKRYPYHFSVQLPDHFDARIPNHGSPLNAARHVLEQLRKGGDVMILECTNRPSGFLPALLTMLAEPGVHVEKVIYPIRHAGYDLHPDQIGFLHGFWERGESTIDSA